MTHPATPRDASPELLQRAVELGVIIRYEDVDQVMHDADPEVLGRVVEILEADRAESRRTVVPGVHVAGPRTASITIEVTGVINDASLIADGVRMSLDPGAASGRITLPELPIGCHTLVVESGPHVEECTVVVPPATMPGLADDRAWSSLFVPAYALWERDDPMPSYGHLRTAAATLGERGVDMLATLPLYATFLDDPFDPSPYSLVSRLHWNEAYISDDALPSAIVPDLGGVVDWRQVGARRRNQLVEAAAAADRSLVDRLNQFVAAHPDVGAYARFMTDRDAVGGEVVERSHVLAQMLCDEQISSIAEQGGAGLSIDLPVGSHPAGYETWAHPGLFAPDIAVGAPPDAFFVDGQNWGFPPQLPGQMRHSGYALWRQMIERAGRHAAMLRIDHVMAVHRLWWVPDGCSADRGVYVRYPERELLAIIAASAAAADVAVVGENLGTVPPEVGAALDEFQMLGMYEEQFTTGESRLADIPARSVAGVRTHDMAAFAEHVDNADLTTYARNLAESRTEPVDDLLDAVLERLARSDAAMVVADLDDLLGERRPHNLPGRVVPGIWQRRLDRPASEVLADDMVRRRLAILNRMAP
ncbi:MAG: 4-alpha-glucanotransferase [Ilumatobacter sp.]